MQAKMFYSRVQSIFHRRGRKVKHLEISAPFDLRLEPVILPGLSSDELAILREKAVASRIGIFDSLPRSSSSMASWDSHPAASIHSRSNRAW